jgi:hypothetical protein
MPRKHATLIVAAHRVAEARRIFLNQSSPSNGGKGSQQLAEIAALIGRQTEAPDSPSPSLTLGEVVVDLAVGSLTARLSRTGL